jgi:chromosome segregation ATPase
LSINQCSKNQSVNEELQSANEELESDKEEIQSVNEELYTINAEVGSKDELLTIDPVNLLDSTEIATIRRSARDQEFHAGHHRHFPAAGERLRPPDHRNRHPA